MVGPFPLTVLLVLSLSTWAVLAWRRQRRRAQTGAAPVAHRRRRPATVALILFAVLSTTTTAAAAVNDDFAYLPRVGDVTSLATGEGPWPVLTAAQLRQPGIAARYPHGGVLTMPIPDDGTGLGRTSALVYLPPQYLSQPSARFPVLYLFHGSPGVPADWLRGGRLVDTAGALASHGLPAIVVVPRVSRGWLDDPECVDGVHEQVETHVFSTVIPLVDATLRTLPNRRSRALGGMSAGGYCALNLGLKHRDEIGTILDFSGLVEPTHSGGLRPLYGADTARAAADTPRTYAPLLSASPATRVWFDVGRGDGEVRPGVEALAPVLRARGVNVVLRERPGKHTFHVWVPALAESLAWALPAMEPSSASSLATTSAR